MNPSLGDSLDLSPAAPVPVPEPQAVAWHWMAKNKMSTWPAWSLGPERPAFAPVDAIPLFAAAPLSGGDVKVTEEMVEIAARAFDPFPFESWQGSYDYEMLKSGDETEAKAFADWSMGKRLDEIRTGMRAALTAALSTMGGKQP